MSTGRRAGRGRLRTGPSAVVSVAVVVSAAALVLGAAPQARAATDGASACAPSSPEVLTEQPWPQARLGLASLQTQYRGWGVRIAVLSSGVSGEHPQLRGRVLDGMSVGDPGPANVDCLGFGTAIAGAAAAAPVSGTGLVGIAPAAAVVPVRLPDWVVNPSSTLDDEHRGEAATYLAQALTAALSASPDVVVLPSVSLPDTVELRAAVAAAEQRGTLLLEGAPLSGDETFAYPAAYPEVLVVAGYGPDDEVARTALDADQVDLLAPGTEVPVLAPGGGHRLVSTNAAAAGYAAGAAALVVEALSPTSAADLRRDLRRSAVPSVAGRVPMLDPSTAMSPPTAAVTTRESGTVGRIAAAASGPDRASLAGSAVAAGSVACLALVLFAATAAVRGARRGWRPAGRPERPAEPVHGLPISADPYQPPGAGGAWWFGPDDGADDAAYDALARDPAARAVPGSPAARAATDQPASGAKR